MAADKLVDSTRLDNALEYTAQRIRVKSGSSDSINFDLENEKGFGDAIDAIPTGGGSSEVEYKDVNFYGLNAELLYSYTLAEAQALTALPTLPTDDVNGVPMTYDWVVTLNTINSLTSSNIPYNVCVAACPTDGKTHIHIELEGERLSPYLGLCINGSVEINWGDNSSNDTVTGTSISIIQNIQHIYASVGEYEITLNVSGTMAILGDSSSYSRLLWKNKTNNENKTYQNSIKGIEIGNGIRIENNAFHYCVSLISITIPSGVTNIETHAFDYCYSLPSITIPSSITNIGVSAFHNCCSLNSIAIPNSVTSIGNSAFIDCSALTSIIIPSSITSIESNMFNYCRALNSVVIPSSVVSIGGGIFYCCDSIVSVTIPSGVTSMGSGIFSTCFSFTSTNIPSGVTSIEARLFNNCFGMSLIKFESSTPPTVVNANAFTGIPTDCKILVPQGSLSAYTSAANYPSSSTYTYEEY